MARPLWTGSLSFGLVNVPVKLFSAVHQKEVRFHMLHDEDGARIRQRRVCSKDGEEVPAEHIVKGYEVASDEYVVLTPKELGAFAPESSRAIAIEDFVQLEEIDPIYWEHTYYLTPDRGARRAYGLLHAALERTRKVAIARFVMRNKAYLCTVRTLDNALVLSTMQYADEVLPTSKLEGLPEQPPRPKGRELEMAEQLIDSLTTKFKPSKYKDTHREEVLALIERKAKGERIVAPPAAPKPGKTADLMAALKASLRAAERQANEDVEAKGARRHRVQAARATRKR